MTGRCDMTSVMWPLPDVSSISKQSPAANVRASPELAVTSLRTIERTAPARGELQLVGAGQAPRARPRPAPRHPPRAAPTSTSGGRAAVQPAPLVKRFDLCPIGRPDSRARVRPPPWSYQPAFLATLPAGAADVEVEHARGAFESFPPASAYIVDIFNGLPENRESYIPLKRTPVAGNGCGSGGSLIAAVAKAVS